MDEHRAVRTAAGLFDVSHMGEIIVAGRHAARFLDYILPNAVGRINPGRAIYSPMCNERGGTIDDLIAWRLAEDRFLLCVNASNIDKDFDWIHRWRSGFDCDVKNVSADYALIALQGPCAASILSRLTVAEMGQMPSFSFVEALVADLPCIISRTGYTGEDGFEIFCAQADAEALATGLLDAGRHEELQLAGLGARDTLRLEAGYPLYGHELSDEISPLEAGLGWAVKFEKGDFIGREALLSQKENGLRRKVIFFRAGSRRILRGDTPVLCGDRQVGRVLSGTLSPCLNEAIGSAIVEITAIGQPMFAEIRGQRQNLAPAKPPFYSHGHVS